MEDKKSILLVKKFLSIFLHLPRKARSSNHVSFIYMSYLNASVKSIADSDLFNGKDGDYFKKFTIVIRAKLSSDQFIIMRGKFLIHVRYVHFNIYHKYIYDVYNTVNNS